MLCQSFMHFISTPTYNVFMKCVRFNMSTCIQYIMNLSLTTFIFRTHRTDTRGLPGAPLVTPALYLSFSIKVDHYSQVV